MNSLTIDQELISELIAPTIKKHQWSALQDCVIPTGIESIDSKLLYGGLRRGQAYFIRGVDYIGRMSFVLNIVANQISNKKDPAKVLFAAGAHDLQSILTRLCCITANVPSIEINGEYSAEDILKIKQAAKVISNSEIVFFSTSSTEEMRLRCFEIRPDIIIFDHPLSGKEQLPGSLFSTLSRESDSVVLALTNLHVKAAAMLRKHKTPEMIVESALSSDMNLNGFAQFIIHRNSFYELLKEDKDFYDFLILYYDGFNSVDAVHCIRNRRSEKIISNSIDQEGGCK